MDNSINISFENRSDNIPSDDSSFPNITIRIPLNLIRDPDKIIDVSPTNDSTLPSNEALPNTTQVHHVSIALTTNVDAQAKKNTSKDPSVQELGLPTNLNYYLSDSGATQHMTPRLADLFDVKGGLNLGIEVADSHIILCSTISKIKIIILNDHRCPLQAILY